MKKDVLRHNEAVRRNRWQRLFGFGLQFQFEWA